MNVLSTTGNSIIVLSMNSSLEFMRDRHCSLEQLLDYHSLQTGCPSCLTNNHVKALNVGIVLISGI